jgi:hypothetical protein
MPGRIQTEVIFPSLPAWRRRSRRSRIALELSLGLILFALIGLGASMQVPGWMRLIGWAFLLGSLAVQSILVFLHWKRRGGWQK